MTKKKCSNTRLSQIVYKRDFCSHVFANPNRILTLVFKKVDISKIYVSFVSSGETKEQTKGIYI